MKMLFYHSLKIKNMKAEEFRLKMVLAAMSNPDLTKRMNLYKEKNVAGFAIMTGIDSADYIINNEELRKKLGIEPD